MSLDFENNFIKPLLLDIQNGNIPNTQTYCGKIAEYYERTVLKGSPNNIPKTLVSPTLTAANAGVPVSVPISIGQDAYTKPNSYRSQLAMYRTLAQYYITKELVAGQQDLEQSIRTLETIIRKQSFNVQRVKKFINEVRAIKIKLSELPSTIKNVIDILIKEVEKYKKQIDDIILEIQSEEFKQRLEAAGLGAPAQIFAEEFQVVNTLKNVNFKNPASLSNALTVVVGYARKIDREIINSELTSVELRVGGLGDQRSVKIKVQKDIKTRIERIISIADGLIRPSAIGPLLATITADTVEARAELKNAIQSYKRFKQIEDELRPQLVNLERIIKQEKEQVKALLKRKIQDIKEVISKKQKEMAEKRLARRAVRVSRRVVKSPKITLLTQAKDDIQTFRKNNEETIKVARKKIQLTKAIIRDTQALVKKTKTIRDGIIKKEVPELKANLTKAFTQVTDFTGVNRVFENVGLLNTSTGSLNNAGTQASASFAQVSSKLSSSFSGDIRSDAIAVRTELAKQGGKYLNKSSDVQFIETYLKEQGLAEIAQPFILLAKETKASFQDYRIFVEQKEEKYEQYYRSITSLEIDFKKITNNIERLRDEKVFIFPADVETDAYKRRRQRYEERQLRRDKKRRERVQRAEEKVPAKWSLMSILKAIKKFLQKQIDALVAMGLQLKLYIKDKIEKAKKFAEKIKTAAIASVPVPGYQKDKQTKAEAAKQKQQLIKEHQAKLQTYKAKGQAIALASRAGSQLIVNVSQNKLRASDNEKWLKQIADARFQYDTVNIRPDDPKYKTSEEEKTSFLENVTSLYIIEKYVDLILLVFKAAKDRRGTQILLENKADVVVGYGQGFIEDLKNAALKIGKQVGGKREDGTQQIIADFTSNQLVSIFIDLFSAENGFGSILSKLKKIFRELNGQVLSSLLRSVDFTQALIDVEQRYLYDVQVAIRKIVGTLDTNSAEAEELEKAKLESQLPSLTATKPTKTKDFRQIGETEKAIKKKVQKQMLEAKERLKKFNYKGFNFYEEMKKLDRAITKRNGSFLVAIIDRIIWQINYFENRVKKQVTEWIKEKGVEVREGLKKAVEENNEKFTKIKQKLANIDAAAMSFILGYSARVFWTGTTWINQQGTTFQVYTIGRFPKLKTNGATDGGEALVREIAENFQKQLNGMRGQAFPQPSYGLPPIPFTGYGSGLGPPLAGEVSVPDNIT